MGGGGALTLLTITSLFWLAGRAAAARGGVILHNDGLHQPDISTSRQPACAGVHTAESIYIPDEELTCLHFFDSLKQERIVT